MKVVTFIKNFQSYFGGDNPDSAQFEEKLANALIENGVAKEYEGLADDKKDESADKKAGKKF